MILPPSLPGFKHIRRKWNETQQSFAARLLPGEYYVTLNDECIYTTLGSCVSACIRDPISGIGGMNHFMLPASADSNSWRAGNLSAATRYGNYAMEHLINEILKNGGQRQNLEAKFFGGGRIMQCMTDIGSCNIKFVRDYLEVESIEIVSEDVGDIYPRMIVYFPRSGKVKVKRLASIHTIIEAESRYIRAVANKPVDGEIEIF